MITHLHDNNLSTLNIHQQTHRVNLQVNNANHQENKISFMSSLCISDKGGKKGT